MKEDVLKHYQMTKKELIMLWLENYEFCESFKDITTWTYFTSINEFVDRLVMCKNKISDEYFRFRLNLEATEEIALHEYLLKRKRFVLKYILSRESFDPTHLYQLYLQYLPYELNDVEKSCLLDGYINILTSLQGKNSAIAKRTSLEKLLNLRSA